MNKKEIEFWENHYLNQIEFMLKQDMEKMIEGLKSKDKIKEDWFDAFDQSNEKNVSNKITNIIYIWLANKFRLHKLSVLEKNIVFETCNAFINIRFFLLESNTNSMRSYDRNKPVNKQLGNVYDYIQHKNEYHNKILINLNLYFIYNLVGKLKNISLVLFPSEEDLVNRLYNTNNLISESDKKNEKSIKFTNQANKKILFSMNDKEC